MDFNLTEDRRMLSDSLGRYLTDQYPIDHRNKVAYSLPAHDPAKWNEMAELGALFAFAPEEAGGFGGSGFDISVVFEALGRSLCPEPMLGAAMCARLLTGIGADQEGLLSGGTKYALAVSEVEAPYDVAYSNTTATAKGDAYTLSGRKTSVYGGQVADAILVAAMLNGKIGLFQINASDAQIVGYPMMDGGGAAEVLMDDTPATLLLADAAEADGNLPLDIDPKLAWALKFRASFPVDVNHAAKEQLLRVPGLGTTAVGRILAARRHRTLRLDDVARLTASIAKVRPFICALDWRPTLLTDRADLRRLLAPKQEQLELF